jgi:NADH:ubiquinone oxidoreductase subunit
MLIERLNRVTSATIVAVMMLFCWGTVEAATITRIDRAIHDGFELLIIHSDSLPEFNLEYDRVSGVARLELKNGRIKESVVLSLARMKSGTSLRGVFCDRKRGIVSFRTSRSVFIRDYLVAGPPALILDFSSEDSTSERLPFELDRDGYLKLGGKAETKGNFDLALKYVDHVRQWAGSDLALTHRAGVIQQRLGRWDVALETLARSAELAEFAADAHARRTMIYLAKGDTAAMGREWAGYFHQGSESKPSETALVAAVDSTEQTKQQLPTTDQPAVQQGSAPERRRIDPVETVRKLQAGGLEDGYLYYGWGFLGLGALSLFGLFISGRKRALPQAAYGSIDISVTGSEPDVPSASRPETAPLRDMRSSGLYTPQPLPVPNQTVSPPLVYSPKPVINLPPSDRYPKPTMSPEKIAPSSIPPGAKPIPPVKETRRERVPVDKILELASSGASEGEIAYQLMVGRDEVAMVLNLSRLARRGSARQDDGLQ